MEPLVKTLRCPSCGEANIAFFNTAETDCEQCGFHSAVYSDRVLAARHYKRYLADSDVIVVDPVQLPNERWLIAHTRLLLV